MTKKELREKYKILRLLLTEEEVEQQSVAIVNNLLQLPIWDKTNYHVFLPILKQKEVNTEFLLHMLTGRDKTILVSKSDFATHLMQHFILTDDTRFETNKYGIPEPQNGEEVSADIADVIFVPLLAFDRIGNRVGYGKGFYDRFLASCRKDAIKVGLSFFEAEPICSEVFESDITLDYCVTPNRIYSF